MKFWKRIALICLVLGLLVLAGPFMVQAFEQSKIYSVEDIPEHEVVIVFGAGIGKNGGPSDVLYDRLTVASQLFKAGKVQKILVSGDNSYEGYNEPEVMSETLQNAFAIPAEVIAEDYAGRRTYDTCVRAHEIWGVEEAILVTQDFHLPRVLYTCNALGIDSVGVSASLQAYVYEDYYGWREYAATIAMFVDLYLWAPDYIQGEAESW